MKKLIKYINDLIDYILKLECCTGDKIEPRPNVLGILREVQKMERELNEK